MSQSTSCFFFFFRKFFFFNFVVTSRKQCANSLAAFFYKFFISPNNIRGKYQVRKCEILLYMRILRLRWTDCARIGSEAKERGSRKDLKSHAEKMLTNKFWSYEILEINSGILMDWIPEYIESNNPIKTLGSAMQTNVCNKYLSQLSWMLNALLKVVYVSKF